MQEIKETGLSLRLGEADILWLPVVIVLHHLFFLLTEGEAPQGWEKKKKKTRRADPGKCLLKEDVWNSKDQFFFSTSKVSQERLFSSFSF